MTRAGDELGMAVDGNPENKSQHQLGHTTIVERYKQSRVEQEEPGRNGEDGFQPRRHGEESCDVRIHGDDIGNYDWTSPEIVDTWMASVELSEGVPWVGNDLPPSLRMKPSGR